MKVIRDIHQMQRLSEDLRKKGKTLAFVPTLGALHEGHFSLIHRARKKGDMVILSIFLNPIQFSDPMDLKNYPKSMRRDLHQAQNHHVDIVFCPSEKQMYSKDFSTYIVEENLSKDLCGQSRPGHFRGVTTVVAKLFNIVKPHIALFGQKDAQQAIIIQRMVRDLSWDIEIKVASILRDRDGLAYSSRNIHLSPEEREQALALNEALFLAKIMAKGGEKNSSKIIQKIKKVIRAKPLAKVDYVEIVDAQTLEKVKTIEGKVLIALAIYIGKTRLIDNLII
ncbi:MAG: pantoate--beta-alanine ligase [Chlamydiae bacterium]|nr:pantoate--beta-alanine ligase [Chlamydiota bacterium]MBI3277728.1 pantoate--beta-alanine ligase [Chlamydiota bacterium]